VLSRWPGVLRFLVLLLIRGLFDNVDEVTVDDELVVANLDTNDGWDVVDAELPELV
jgi:hypothetical protein